MWNELKDKKRSVKVTIYVVLMAVLVIYLVFAGQIVSAFYYGEARVRKITGGLERYEVNTQAEAWVKSVDYLDGPEREVNISGYAFCESDKKIDGLKKKVKILLVAKNGTVYQAGAAHLADLTEFSRTKTQEKYNPASDRIKFIAVFSVLSIPQGSYDIFLYIEESAEMQGLAKTQTQVVVTPDIVYEAGSVVDDAKVDPEFGYD